ncbi:metallophosphoesterase family protein [Mycobacterium servetii]|uniref:Metallophosphoesterase n=1 Tax=Mycobacterium servetii TaxID=3237418 RepID=A0ABV4C895_9MYCO
MRLLVLADTEPDWTSIPHAITTHHADTLITAGDLNHTWLNNAHITDAPVPTIGIHGNHDTTPYLATLNITNLHLTPTTINATTFIGLEGCVRYKRRGHDVLYTQQEYAEMIADMPAADVLVTHCPPAGINDHPDPAHVGIIALRDWIDTHKPALLIHGHTYPETPLRQYRSTRVEYVRGAALVSL